MRSASHCRTAPTAYRGRLSSLKNGGPRPFRRHPRRVTVATPSHPATSRSVKRTSSSNADMFGNSGGMRTRCGVGGGVAGDGGGAVDCRSRAVEGSVAGDGGGTADCRSRVLITCTRQNGLCRHRARTGSHGAHGSPLAACCAAARRFRCNGPMYYSIKHPPKPAFVTSER